MRLSELIIAVRLKLNDPNRIYWSDVQITRELNKWQRDLWRQQVEAHESYGNRVHDLIALDNAEYVEQLDTRVFAYTLPSWAYKVRSIDVRENGATTKRLVYVETGDLESGWTWHDHRAIVVRGYPIAKDLRFNVAKVPALLCRGSVSIDSPDAKLIYFPTTLPIEAGATESMPVDLEDGALAGANIEITNATPSRDPRGVIARVVDQTREYSAALAAWQFAVEVRPTYPDFVKAADTFEFHAEIAEPHLNYLILRTAESLFHTTNNIAGVAVLQPQLAREHNAFESSLQPRTNATLHVVRTVEDDSSIIDPDRDPYFST